jgi:tetratricopeptide (TPR) repeat protein
MLAKDRASRPGDTPELGVRFAKLVDELLAAGYGDGSALLRARTPPPLPLGGEQRVLSAVMVSRPRPLPPRPGGPDPKALAQTWSEGATAASANVFDEAVFAGLRQAMDALGARLDRFLDGSMVVTLVGRGAPTDQAVQAARCALKLKELLPGSSLAVSTGRAVVGAELPIGSVIDGAARLLFAEPPGTICVDATTAGLLESRFEVGGEGKRYLLFEKGLKEAPRTLLGRETPCVGRDRELAAIEAVFDECLLTPAARAVLVTAPPGGGKSRVRFELVERLHGRGEPFELLVGQGDPLRSGAPFGLLGPALRSGAGIGGTEPPIVQRKRLHAHVARHLAADRAAVVSAFLGEICGVPFPDEDLPALAAARKDARLMADQTLGAWLTFVEAVTAQRPVLLVLEDMHWGDVPSVQLVDAALRAHRDRPFMVLALGRPEVDEKFAGLWADRDLQRIALPPLTSKACQKLARAILGQIGDERAAWIVERADGNPFVLEELLRALASGTPLGEGVVLPESVIGMVQARFDALGSEAKHILRAASIFGQTFRRSAVAALLGEDDARSLADWLQVLASREIVFPRSTGETQEFAFRHALLRDAAYDLIPDEARRLGHRLAGDWLEREGEPKAIVLVEHFERGEDFPRAAHWSRAAAIQALEANDLGAAVDRAGRGIRLGAEGETRALLRLVEAQARFWRGEFSLGEAAAREARGLLARDSEARFEATSELIAALGQQAKFEEIEALLDEVTPREGRADVPEAQLACVLRAADFLMLAGHYGRTERALETVAAYGRRLGPPLVAQEKDLRAKLACHSGDHAAGVAGFETALKIFSGLGDERRASEMEINLGLTLGEIGNLDEAEQHLRRVLATGERLGLEILVAATLMNLVQVLAHEGKTGEARAMGERALALARKQEDPRCAGATEIYLALVESRDGAPSAAEVHARAAVALLDGVPTALPLALAELARALLAQGKVREALAEARRAHELLDAVGRVEDGEATIRLVYAEALAAAGARAAAREVLAAASARLESRAAGIARSEWRAKFLTRLRDHARTAELLHAWR